MEVAAEFYRQIRGFSRITVYRSPSTRLAFISKDFMSLHASGCALHIIFYVCLYFYTYRYIFVLNLCKYVKCIKVKMKM